MLFRSEEARRAAERHIACAKEAVGVYGEKAEFLLQLADFILARRN